MKTYQWNGQIYTLDNGVWFDSGAFEVSPWWQDRLTNRYPQK